MGALATIELYASPFRRCVSITYMAMDAGEGVVVEGQGLGDSVVPGVVGMK